MTSQLSDVDERTGRGMAYERRWRCRKCGSERLTVAVEWDQTVEDVDQHSEQLEPLGCSSSSSRILRCWCDVCAIEGGPELFERRRVRV